MRKYITLLLVLAISSVAGADTMIISGLPASLNTVAGPSVLSFDVVSDGQLDNATMYVYNTAGGTLDIASAINNVVDGEIYDDAENLGYLAGCVDVTGIVQPVIWAEIALPHVPSEIIVGDILSDLGLTIPQGFVGMIDVSALNENDCSVQSMVTIDCFVPEPVTIALLGLGGLFLRRRK